MNMDENCLACNNPLGKHLEWSNNYTTLYEYICTTCTNKFKTSFRDIKDDVKNLIKKNPQINNELDLIVKNEALWNFSERNPQHSSVQLREYMFSMLEEIHQFIYHAAFELDLYVENFRISDETFFSERYFLNNSVIKTIGAWEKVFMFYSLYFEAEIRPKTKLNTLQTMKKSLNKTDFKKIDTYTNFQSVMSNGSFKKIDEARKYNDHDVSYHLGKNLLEMLEVSKAILKNLKVLYSSLEEGIELFKIKARISDKKFIENYIPNFKIEINDKVFKKKGSKIDFPRIESNITSINQNSIRYILDLEQRIGEVGKWKIQYSNPPLNTIYYRLFDVVMRLHEAARSLGYAMQLYTEAVKIGYEIPAEHEIKFPGMNYRYFIHSALIRVYACYDKIGFIVREMFEIEGVSPKASLEKIIKYLLDREDDDLIFVNSLPPIKLINYILSKKEYKKIYSNRQDFFHNLIKQNFIVKSYASVIDLELIDIIITNGNLIYEVIDSLDVSLQNFHMIGLYHEQQ